MGGDGMGGDGVVMGEGGGVRVENPSDGFVSFVSEEYVFTRDSGPLHLDDTSFGRFNVRTTGVTYDLTVLRLGKCLPQQMPIALIRLGQPFRQFTTDRRFQGKVCRTTLSLPFAFICFNFSSSSSYSSSSAENEWDAMGADGIVVFLIR